jgi:hypothetical protein
MPKKREITQITTMPSQTGSGSLVALASDGTLWQATFTTGDIVWKQLSTLGVDTKNDHYPTP